MKKKIRNFTAKQQLTVLAIATVTIITHSLYKKLRLHLLLSYCYLLNYWHNILY